MRTRRIPHTDLELSEIGVSVAECVATRRMPADEAGLTGILRDAFDRGVTCFDVTDPAGEGLGETVLARALAGHRREIVLVASGGPSPTAHRRELFERVDEAARAGHLIAPGAGRPPRDLRAESLRRSCEESLRRLATDVLDLFLIDRPTPALLERDAFWSALERLKSDGKIREYGVTAHPGDDERDVLAAAGESRGNRALGVVYGPVRQEPVRSFAPPGARPRDGDRPGPALLVRKPTAWGLLESPDPEAARRAGEPARPDPDTAPPWLAEARRHVSALRFFQLGGAGEAGRSVEQAAAGFALAHPQTACVFPPIRTRADVAAFAAAGLLPPLVPEEIEAIEAAWQDVFAALTSV